MPVVDGYLFATIMFLFVCLLMLAYYLLFNHLSATKTQQNQRATLEAPPLYETITSPPNYDDVFKDRHPLDHDLHV
ncbi:hypothetical protein ACKWTF_013404 [Chironomus riparius]